MEGHNYGSRFKVQSSRFSDLKVQSDQRSMTKFKVQGQSDLKVDDMVNNNFSMIE